MYLTPANLAVILLVGGFTGLLGAILGTGGGVFLIPVLVLGLGVPMHYAVATGILSVIATSSAVAGTNVERGTANMRLGMTLEVATALGAIAGGLTAGWLRPSVLEGLFALVLLPTALLMGRGRSEGGEDAEGGAEGKAPPIDGGEEPGGRTRRVARITRRHATSTRPRAGSSPTGSDGSGRGWASRSWPGASRACWASAAACSRCRPCTCSAACRSRRRRPPPTS